MANNDGIGAGGLFVAFVAGALAGAAVALLFAPAAGDETREYLGQRAREGRDRAADAARQGRDILARNGEGLLDVFERGRQAYQAARTSQSEQEPQG